MNIPITPSTIDIILSRTRDVDAVTRKLIYSAVISGRIEHPRQLSIAQRELIVKDGLGDREPSVRVSAGKVVTQWFDWVIAPEHQEEETEDDWQGDDGGVMKGLIKFLGLFDVVGPGEAVAVDALLSVLTNKNDLLGVFVFPGTGRWLYALPLMIHVLTAF